MSSMIYIKDRFLDKVYIGIKRPILVIEHILTSRDFKKSRITRVKIAKEKFSRPLSNFLNFEIDEIKTFFNELVYSDFINSLISRGLKDAKATILISEGALLYVVCRIIKPEIVIETGVGAGLSTSFILKCLNDIGRGLLYSIDLPDQDILRGKEISYLIPPEYKKRWKLYIGDSKNILPQVLTEVSEVDISFHDAYASYEHQMFEYTSVWRKLRKGGLLISDNIDLSKAFFEFSKEVKCPTMVVGVKFGLLLKC
jgi:predicted O-methyltransferase YrrM